MHPVKKGEINVWPMNLAETCRREIAGCAKKSLMTDLLSTLELTALGSLCTGSPFDILSGSVRVWTLATTDGNQGA